MRLVESVFPPVRVSVGHHSHDSKILFKWFTQDTLDKRTDKQTDATKHIISLLRGQ